MALPAYVQKVFDEQVAKNKPAPPSIVPQEEPSDISESGIMPGGVPSKVGLPDYVRKAMAEKKQPQQEPSDPRTEPQEWDPDWMRDHPMLAGLYGAGKGLLEQAIVPSVEAVGMVAGSLGSPIAGTALGYGIARQLNDYLVDGYKRLGGEDPRRPTVSEEMIQSASDVGTVLVLGKVMDTGARIAPIVENYMFNTLPKRLYGRAIKTPMSKKWIKTLPDEIISKQTAAIEEGLNSRVAPGKYGLSKIKGLQREVEGYIDDVTNILSENPKNFVSREAALEKGLKKAYAKASDSSDPEGAKIIVDSIAERFRAHPINMTPAKANQVKRQLYNEVKYGSGEGATAIKTEMDSTGKKGVAREIMLNLEEIYPELAELNATSAARISLHEAVEKTFAEEFRRSAIPLGAKVLMRPSTWPLAVWEATMGHPQIKARLAFALHKANPVKYPAKPPRNFSTYLDTPSTMTTPGSLPEPPKPAGPLKYEPPTKPSTKSPIPKPLPKVKSPGAVVDKPISGTYTPDQLNKMLKSKNVSEVDMAIEDIIDVRKRVQVNERERTTVINDMLKSFKNERGSIGDKPPTKLFSDEQQLENLAKKVEGQGLGLPPSLTRMISLVKETEKGIADGTLKNTPKQMEMLQGHKDELLSRILDSRKEIKDRFPKEYLSSLARKGGKKNLTEPVTVKPSTAGFNKLYPQHDLKFDGMQEAVPGSNKPPTYQVTPQKGPLKGRTVNVDSLEPKVIKAKLDSMKPTESSLPKDEILYHTTDKPLKGGKPDFDAYFGDKGWVDAHAHNFGGNTHAVKVPPNAKILNLLEDGSKEAHEFMAKVAKKHAPNDKEYINKLLKGNDEAIAEFYSYWDQKKYLADTVKQMGYEGARFNDEYFLTKELINKTKSIAKPKKK